jgi:hypothetical protein
VSSAEWLFMRRTGFFWWVFHSRTVTGATLLPTAQVDAMCRVLKQAAALRSKGCLGPGGLLPSDFFPEYRNIQLQSATSLWMGVWTQPLLE